jgi:hypothetical protein
MGAKVNGFKSDAKLPCKTQLSGSITGQSDSQDGKRWAVYDLKKLRGKKLLEISGRR